jgi:hypothetical protein
VAELEPEPRWWTAEARHSPRFVKPPFPAALCPKPVCRGGHAHLSSSWTCWARTRCPSWARSRLPCSWLTSFLGDSRPQVTETGLWGYRSAPPHGREYQPQGGILWRQRRAKDQEGEAAWLTQSSTEGWGQSPGCGWALPEPLILQHELMQHRVEVPLGPGHPGPMEPGGCREAVGNWMHRALGPICTLPPPQELIPLGSTLSSWSRKRRFSSRSCSTSTSTRWGCFAPGDCGERGPESPLKLHMLCAAQGLTDMGS